MQLNCSFEDIAIRFLRFGDFSSTSIIKLCSVVDFIETWDEQTMFYFRKYSAVACHKFSQFNSQVFILDLPWNYYRLQEAKTFWRKPGQFKCVTRKNRSLVSITEFLIWNLYSQVAWLVRRLRIILNILYFTGDHQCF